MVRCSKENDTQETAQETLFGHHGPNLVEHATLLIDQNTTLIKLMLRIMVWDQWSSGRKGSLV